MTESRKRAARLREYAADPMIHPQEQADLLAGAEALEAQGEWRIAVGPTRDYFIPVERWDDWRAWLIDREPGEPSSIVPEWAKPVPYDVIVTGWRKNG